MGNEEVNGGSSDEPQVFGPDTVIAPGGSVAQSAQPAQPAQPQAASLQPPAPESQPAAPTEMPAQTYTANPSVEDPNAITWTASEFIAHSKSSSWYGLLALAALVIAGGVWLLTRDFFTTAAVIAGVALLAAYAGRQPKQETYTVDDYGIAIGNRRYGFGEFRSFALTSEGAFASIELNPSRRFAINTTIYFDPADEDAIITKLSAYLPMEDAQSNLADSLMRRIHF